MSHSMLCLVSARAKLHKKGEPVLDFDWLLSAVGVRSNNGTATRDFSQSASW